MAPGAKLLRLAMTRLPSVTVTKWRALALKRLGYLAELQRTGRWRLHYPTQDAFNAALRAADADAERWKRVAYGSPPIEAAE
jgi:histidinol-phosphate/aromatic aminotransferase/cobyric acid decarboxylase-like protein